MLYDIWERHCRVVPRHSLFLSFTTSGLGYQRNAKYNLLSCLCLSLSITLPIAKCQSLYIYY